MSSNLAVYLTFSIRTALGAVAHNTLRALLTSLGILFGVASVIAMLAIGNGAQQEILEQMRLLGTNNVIVSSVVEHKEDKAKENDSKTVHQFSPGLTIHDAQSFSTVIPNVETTSGEVVLPTKLTREGHRLPGQLVGVDTSYFRLLNLEIGTGSIFLPDQVADGAPVCIIGSGVKARFFTTEEPIGRAIKVGDVWLTVVGVIKDRKVSSSAQSLGIRDANLDVYVPLSTMLLRFRNRAQVTQRDIAAGKPRGGIFFVMGPSQQQDNDNSNKQDDAAKAERENHQQLDRIIVRVDDVHRVPAVADLVRRILTRRHNQVVDFDVTVPELLLKQERRTKAIFNIVLGAIGSISLIVGGIGIMNIMLASVLERIREIGVRRAVGATQRDILAQFLSEAAMISLAGGVAGIIVGVVLSAGIQRFAGIRADVSPISVLVAFGVSITVGLAFGIIPAWRAAQQDPVRCLRYE